MTAITTTLAQRGKRYGAFHGHAELAQNLKTAMQSAPSYAALPKPYKEALEMIQHKIARILNGDPDYDDNWHDIGGYAALGEDEAKARTKAKAPANPMDMPIEELIKCWADAQKQLDEERKAA
jgi:hypothetical protein